MKKTSQNSKQRRILYYVLIGIFAVVFLVCAIKIGDYVITHFQHQALYNGIKDNYSRPTGVVTAPPATTRPSTVPGSVPTAPVPTEPPQMLPGMDVLYERNPHTVGWLYIDEYIDWPVMQTPNTTDWINYYLYRDFDGNDDIRGSLYVRESCNVFAPSDNVVIYGHNMKDMSMFGTLKRYYNQSFYEKHKYIQFDTLYETHTYEIFAVFRTSGTTGVGYPYHMFNNAHNQAEFDEFVATCKSLSFYDTGITPVYGEKLLTLSTCDFRINNGRLVVVARRVS